MTLRSRIAMLVAEFLGTAVLALAIINIFTSVNRLSYFVSIGAGLVIGMLALVLSSTSGAHFNPAITIGQWTVRKIGSLQALAYIAAQMLGALTAWKVAVYFSGEKLINIAGKKFDWKILIAEALGTMVFSFVVAGAVYQGYKGLRFAAAVGGGLFLGITIAAFTSTNGTGLTGNGIVNPAVALAVQSWGRAYIFGPIIGSVIGMNLYALLFTTEKYWLSAAAASGSVKVSNVKVRSSSPARRATPARGRKPAARRRK